MLINFQVLPWWEMVDVWQFPPDQQGEVNDSKTYSKKKARRRKFRRRMAKQSRKVNR